jgi:uncharacterized protein YndB with AHSA1/START domain
VDQFVIEVVIDRPPQAVFDAPVNFDRIPDWNPSVSEVRWTRIGPIDVGGAMTYVGKFLGRNFQSPAEVTEYAAGSRYSARSISGPFLLEVDNRMAPAGDGTRLNSTFRGESRGFFKLAEPVIIQLSKKMFEAAADNLKALLEADAL